MNALANWIFTVLLGWTGSFANRAWNAIVNSADGISDFFTRYWLIIVVALIIGGTVLDYVVWMLRWRPYLVWRSWLSRRRHSREVDEASRSLHGSDMDDDARGRLAGWAATPQEEYPVYDLGSDPYAYGDYQEPPPPPEEGYFSPAPPAQAYAPDQPPYTLLPDAGAGYPPYAGQSDNGAYTPLEPQQPYVPQPEGYFTSAQGDDSLPEPVYPEQEEEPAPGRRRRTDRGKRRSLTQRIGQLRDRLATADDEEGMLDGLPAPVRQRDAFHDAVYPQSYAYQPQRRNPPPPSE